MGYSVAALILFGLVSSAVSGPLVLPLGTVWGESGYVTPDGRNVQFSMAEADDAIVLSGPSGIVRQSGNNVQYRTKRSEPYPLLKGESGIVTPYENIQFKEGGVELILEGPSAYIFSDGTMIQKRLKRSADLNLAVPVGTVFGESGYVTPEGKQVQFTPEIADLIAIRGDSGVLLKDGRSWTFTN